MRRLALSVCALVTLAACLSSCRDDADNASTPADAALAKQLAGLPDKFPAGPPVWAHRHEIHYGDQVLEMPGSHRITEIHRLPQGFLVGQGERVRFFDGDSAIDVGPVVLGVQVSTDGRYVGWLDFSTGDKDKYGAHLGSAVVLDLKEGVPIVRSYRGMGDVKDDDLGNLYESAAPSFKGFADGYGFWESATGDVEDLKVDLSTGDVSTGKLPTSNPLPDCCDYPMVSPGASYVADASYSARITMYDAATGRRVPLRLPSGPVGFATWTSDTEFFARSFKNELDGAGVLLKCSLPAGTCKRLLHLAKWYSIVFDGETVGY